jgi:hypothetical protein
MAILVVIALSSALPSCGGSVPAPYDESEGTVSANVESSSSDKTGETVSFIVETGPLSCDEVEKLSTQIAVRLDNYYLLTACRSGIPEPQEFLAQLPNDGRVIKISRDSAKHLNLPLPRGVRSFDLYVATPEGKKLILAEQGVEKYLSPGGFYSCFIGECGIAGHYEVTGKAIRDLRKGGSAGFGQFSEDAIQLMQDASQDPDFYAWHVPEAHAQSDNDAEGAVLPGDWPQRWVVCG